MATQLIWLQAYMVSTIGLPPYVALLCHSNNAIIEIDWCNGLNYWCTWFKWFHISYLKIVLCSSSNRINQQYYHGFYTKFILLFSPVIFIPSTTSMFPMIYIYYIANFSNLQFDVHLFVVFSNIWLPLIPPTYLFTLVILSIEIIHVGYKLIRNWFVSSRHVLIN